MKKLLMKRLLKNEEGQVIVLFALLLVVLLGFSALAIDVGIVALTKARIQNAADAAALAAAQKLPDSGAAKTTAIAYAGKNGMKATANGVKKDGDTVTATTPYESQTDTIRVDCTRNVSYTFAQVLGFKDTDVTAYAVAVLDKQWNGEALPFINLDDDYDENLKIEAWEKTGPGDFESMWGVDADIPSEYEFFNAGKKDDHSKCYCIVNYSDGITITKGTVANKKDEVGYIYEQHKPVYIFSLSSAVINSGKYAGEKDEKGKDKEYDKLKNKDVIPLADLVLLQVTFDSYDYSGKTLYLTVTDVYDINNGEFPTDHLTSVTGTSKLLE